MRIRWLFLAPCLPLGAPTLRAATLYVDGRVPRTAGDGKSWTTAFPSVQAALVAAQPGDEVWVAAGTYTMNGVLPAGVRLYGGFVGTETYRDQRPGLPDLTILRSSQPSVGPVTIRTGADRDTVLDGFTIEMSGQPQFPALALEATSPTITHNVFRRRVDPSIPYNGPVFPPLAALIVVHGAAPVVRDNIVMDGGGAGIACQDTAAEITNNTIAGNATYGITSERATGPISNNIVAFNQVGVWAIANSVPTLRNNCVFGNAGGNYQGMADSTGTNGNIAQDPRFASYELGNLHIQPDSPCVDAGDETAPHGDRDIDLLPRVMGARIDIGADESDGRHWAVSPRIVRVSPAGNDANDGSSWALAKAGIQAAIDAAAVMGGEVWVAAGTYGGELPPVQRGPLTLPSHVSLYGGFGGTEASRDQRDWGNNASVLAPMSAAAILVAASGNRTSRVDGFIFFGYPGKVPVSGIVCSGAGPVVANNVFTALSSPTTNPRVASVVDGTGGSPLLYNNAIVGNTSTGPGLLAFANAAPTLSHNVISGNSGTNNSALMFGRADTRIELRNNLIASNTGSSLALASILQANEFIFVNNTVTGNGLPFGGYQTSLVANNIFALAGPNVVWRPTSHDKYRNNCFYQSGNVQNIAGRDGNIEAYPGFVDLRIGNYRLRGDSPCVDAGDDSVVQPGEVDLDGAPRIQGRHVDMGAFEFAGAAATPPLPDVLDAMKIAAGLQAATPDDMQWLHPDHQTPGITLTDAVLLLKTLKARAGSME